MRLLRWPSILRSKSYLGDTARIIGILLSRMLSAKTRPITVKPSRANFQYANPPCPSQGPCNPRPISPQLFLALHPPTAVVSVANRKPLWIPTQLTCTRCCLRPPSQNPHLACRKYKQTKTLLMLVSQKYFMQSKTVTSQRQPEAMRMRRQRIKKYCHPRTVQDTILATQPNRPQLVKKNLRLRKRGNQPVRLTLMRSSCLRALNRKRPSLTLRLTHL